MYFKQIMIGIFLVAPCPVGAMENEQSNENNPLAYLFNPQNTDNEEDPIDDEETLISPTDRLIGCLLNVNDFKLISVYKYEKNKCNLLHYWISLTDEYKKEVVEMMRKENYVYIDEQGGAKKIRALIVGTDNECIMKERFGIQEKSHHVPPKLKRSKSFWQKKDKKKVEQEIKVMNPLYKKPYSNKTPVLQKEGRKLFYGDSEDSS